MSDPRIVVIGAGPAGIRAAETLSRYGLRPCVIDEAAAGGGQIYRRPPQGFVRGPRVLYGFEAGKAVRLHAAFDALKTRIDYRPETLVWDISERAAHTCCAGRVERVVFDALILATGAMDRVIPLPGWTMPGVYSLGGAQVALKLQGCSIGARVAFAGTGPLLYLVAYQYAKAGAQVAAVLDTATLAAKLRALPMLAAAGATLAKGAFYAAHLRAGGIPVRMGVRLLAVEGDGRVGGIVYADARGRRRTIECDAVGIGFGLKPETQLADLAGCRFRFDAGSRHWLPECDSEGRALGVPGVYLAGDGAGIGGADAAELTGERAALAALAGLGRTVSAERHDAIKRDLARLRRFRSGLEAAFPFPVEMARAVGDETILCRCEGITVGELRAAARADPGADEINRAKALTRIGMGRCQGRVCGPAAAEILAAATGREVAELGRLRGQAPVKPIAVAALAAAS